MLVLDEEVAWVVLVDGMDGQLVAAACTKRRFPSGQDRTPLTEGVVLS